MLSSVLLGEVVVMDSNACSTGLTLRRILVDDAIVVIEAEGAAAGGTCPDCGATSTRVHARYQRRPLDLPWRGAQVRVRLTVRRFLCANAECSRETFAETFGAALPRRAQRMQPATELLAQFAWAVGAEAGARLACASGLPVSPDTLLRLVRRMAVPEPGVPRVLGVDDLALRRGCSYATLFVDLETHEPIDLVRGRDASVVADWLRAHPGVEILVRDRSGAYAHGARAAAPDVQQVADRFHLVQNASAALDELLRRRRRQVELEAVPVAETRAPDENEAAPPSPSKQQQAVRRTARIARWQQARDLRAQGWGIRALARELAMSRQTVRRLLATPEPPRNRIEHPRPGGISSPRLQPYVTYLQDRWQQGCHNVAQLYREIARQGYTGSRSLLAQALAPWRPPRPPRAPRHQRRRRRSIRWLCLRPPAQLTAEERAALEQVLADDTDLAAGYRLLQDFRTVIAQRDVMALEAWLTAAQSSGLPPFMAMANGIGADRPAVEAGLTTPWSTGPVEGHIHRVKLIKRQGYGRAKLDLLRRRILAA